MSLLGLVRDLQSQRLKHQNTYAHIQRCGRCGLSSEVSVAGKGAGIARPAGFVLNQDDVSEGHAEAESAAKRNAWINLHLARCVSCERRPLTAHALAVVVTLHWTIAGVIVASVGGLLSTWPMEASMTVGGALTLGYAVGRRIGHADLSVKSR